MKPLICGSKALRHWLGDKHWRIISDTDTIGYFVDADLKGYKEESPNFLYTNLKNLIKPFLLDRSMIIRTEYYSC